MSWQEEEKGENGEICIDKSIILGIRTSYLGRKWAHSTLKANHDFVKTKSYLSDRMKGCANFQTAFSQLVTWAFRKESDISIFN